MVIDGFHLDRSHINNRLSLGISNQLRDIAVMRPTNTGYHPPTHLKLQSSPTTTEAPVVFLKQQKHPQMLCELVHPHILHFDCRLLQPQ